MQICAWFRRWYIFLVSGPFGCTLKLKSQLSPLPVKPLYLYSLVSFIWTRFFGFCCYSNSALFPVCVCLCVWWRGREGWGRVILMGIGISDAPYSFCIVFCSLGLYLINSKLVFLFMTFWCLMEIPLELIFYFLMIPCVLYIYYIILFSNVLLRNAVSIVCICCSVIYVKPSAQLNSE